MKNYSIITLIAFIISFTPALQAVSVSDLIKQKRINIKNEILDLSSMKIDSLEGLQNIPKPSTIKKIILFNNNISQLKKEFFESFKKLEILNLSKNEITQLVGNQFEGNKLLTKLNLSDNQISTISRKAFNDLQKLTNLNLTSNHLSTFDVGTFDAPKNKITVILASNPKLEQNALDRIKKRHSNSNKIEFKK